MQGICIWIKPCTGGLLPVSTIGGQSRWSWLYEARCQSHYTWMVMYGDCPIVNTGQYVWAF